MSMSPTPFLLPAAPYRYPEPLPGVLDLSSSRSDTEPLDDEDGDDAMDDHFAAGFQLDLVRPLRHSLPHGLGLTRGLTPEHSAEADGSNGSFALAASS